MEYRLGSRALQARFDTQRLADRIRERLVRDRFTAEDHAFIEARDMFFLATADGEGRPQCSYKGGAPGFVRVLDEMTLIFPDYDGNGMFLSAGNAAENPHVGLLFVDFENGSRLRVNGTAVHSHDDPLLAEFPDAHFLWTVTPHEVFPNCSRYIHKYQLVERSRFVPAAGCAAPIPGWKRSEWAKDVLPEADPARDT